MTEEQIALAKRAVACKGWRWMPGMLAADAIGKQRVYDDVAGEPYWSTDGWLPDFDDAATLGCLLALYEETRKMLTCPDPVYTYASAYGLLHPRTAEALVAALEAAPVQ